MEDRELLELAAKAAGIEIDKSQYNGGCAGNDGFDILGNAVLDWHNGEKWNPLTDDGDALRLAVKLHISIGPYQNTTVCIGPGQGQVAIERDGSAATRRAIVRAAAAIALGSQK